MSLPLNVAREGKEILLYNIQCEQRVNCMYTNDRFQKEFFAKMLSTKGREERRLIFRTTEFTYRFTRSSDFM